MGNSSPPSCRQLVCGPNAIEVEIHPVWKLLFKEVSESGQQWDVCEVFCRLYLGTLGWANWCCQSVSWWKAAGPPLQLLAHIPGRRLQEGM